VGLNDLWHIGSCSKAMTATLAAKLVEEGRLRWDTTLAEVFPELAEKLDPVKRGITLEQLLSHRSGLPLSPRKWPEQKVEDAAGQRLAVLRQVPGAKLVGPPGARFSYSNFGYILAGAMIEKITGKQFKDVMRARLFARLDMPSPEYEGTHAFGEGGVIWSHRPSGRPVPRWRTPFNDRPSLRPAGSVRCNLGDWAKFIRHHLMGQMSGSDYLQAKTYRELHRSRGDNYALGWAVVQRDWGGGTVLQHAGSNGWNESVVWLAPRKGFAVFVCANQGKCDAELDEIVDRLINLVSN
ncbi:MAG: beta-lactamase family protein, partial [Phycisphaerales bacterium]